jgi:hypothetical protein
LGEDATSDDIIVAAEVDRWRTSRRTLGTTSSFSFDFVAEAHVNGSGRRTVGAKETTTGARSIDVTTATTGCKPNNMEIFVVTAYST